MLAWICIVVIMVIGSNVLNAKTGRKLYIPVNQDSID